MTNNNNLNNKSLLIWLENRLARYLLIDYWNRNELEKLRNELRKEFLLVKKEYGLRTSTSPLMGTRQLI